MQNIYGEDGGIAPIAPGPIDYSRGRGRCRVQLQRDLKLRSFSEQPKKTPPSSPDSSPKQSPEYKLSYQS